MVIAIFLSLAISPIADAQPPRGDTIPLSLDAALERAHEFNPTLRAERAEARMAAQGPLEATQAFLPTLEFGLQGLRTTDPVAVFGLKLRQENFASEDLALDPLNRPDPYTGYNTTAMVQLPIFAPEGLFGYSAARRAAAAREAAVGRAAGATTFFVSQAYWGAQLSARRVETLYTGLEAARAHARQAEALNRQGIVTGLDARLARIRAAEIETQLLGATADAANALSALRTMLALPDSQPLVLTDSLAGTAETECDQPGTECDASTRGDLEALRLGTEAASAAVKSAWASHLPSIAVFGTLAYYGQSSPWGSGSGDWTIGVGLKWTPFPALAGVGAVRRAKAERDAALSRREAAERQAELEIVKARRLVAAAGERVSVADNANAEALEALDQAQVRYRTGISPITELLDVQAATTAATLNMHAARHDLFVALAALDFAYGAYDR